MNERNTLLTALLLCGASALGGCATTHVGDDWQCPLTQGLPCLTVPAADPAAPAGSDGVPPTPDANRIAGRSPSAGRRPAYRPEGNASESGRTRTADGSEGEPVRCNAWCRPFAWLWRRGTDETAGDDSESAGETAVEVDVDPAVAPATPGLPDDLRTPEVVGRIWIAPYVDANGVYREASWVRAVLEPARWRRP